ncbi:ATP-NAD kinase-like domain-containing protein [Gaertneriomyces semiglobifer]|nr:ATP-NAD kinase-like domain-containing protein [Gaertneriomyces semiglobifer]
MYRLELVDTAGCGGLEAVDELCERDTSDTDTSDRKSETRSESPIHSTTNKENSPTTTVTPATSSPPTAAPIQRPRTRSTSHAELAKTAVGLREIAKKIGRAQLIWDAPPRTVLIVTKAHEPGLVRVTKNVTKWLANALHLKVVVEDRMRDDPVFEYDDLVASVHDLVDFWTLESVASIASVIDFVITLGGDGTVLYAAWMFQQKCPPILPFRLGSLGFLTTFDFRQFRESVVTSESRGMRMNFRMRFSCTIIRHHQQPLHLTYHILNDLTIDRGPSPYMSSLELYGNSHLLTTLASDGLVISTPTGSTAYSLSAGGSLVHPDVSAILVTPICPHTLSFRPMVLPDTMELCVAVPSDSRTTAWASLDGRLRVQLNKGDRIVVRAGVWPVPTVCWEDQSRDWFKGLERCLGWGRRERQKAFGEEQGDVWKW